MQNDLVMFVPTAIRAILGDLAPQIAAAAGASVVQCIDLNPAIPERISAGEAYDIGLTNPPYVTGLIASGHADAATHLPFGRIPLAIGARAGSGKPAICDGAMIADVLRAADSIAYTGAGTSGRMFLQAAETLGVAPAIVAKSMAVDGGVPVQLVLSGDAEIAIAPLTTILATPGIVPIAHFPDALDTHIDISIFLHPARCDDARRVLAFLTDAALDDDLAKAGISRFTWS